MWRQKPFPELDHLSPAARDEVLEAARRDAAAGKGWLQGATMLGVVGGVAGCIPLSLWLAGHPLNPGFPFEVVFVALLAATLIGVAWLADWAARHFLLQRHLWRRLEGLCDGCGYSLRGNMSGVCPECGRAHTHRPASFR